ncbi:hypothetical protein PV08_11732 [Exophiala spinifera]|uniref:Uncharacterized protein n=1 Tax=Exophiala spinifera TaxID=91928 RepID=A0A0D1Y4V5_9EURO|nr:uncharacterized protein PV08_11732 [Exophiala spinifera]KIW09956.1 hypothetical protein PV08_11732 [Exophiala spinifera]
MASEPSHSRHSSSDQTKTEKIASLQEELLKVLDNVKVKFGLNAKGREAFNKELDQTIRNAIRHTTHHQEAKAEAVRTHEQLWSQLASLNERFSTLTLDFGLDTSEDDRENEIILRESVLQLVRDILSTHPEIIAGLQVEMAEISAPVAEELDRLRRSIRQLDSVSQSLGENLAKFSKEHSSFAETMKSASTALNMAMFPEEREHEQAWSSPRDAEEECISLRDELKKLKSEAEREKEAHKQTRNELGSLREQVSIEPDSVREQRSKELDSLRGQLESERAAHKQTLAKLKAYREQPRAGGAAVERSQYRPMDQPLRTRHITRTETEAKLEKEAVDVLSTVSHQPTNTRSLKRIRSSSPDDSNANKRVSAPGTGNLGGKVTSSLDRVLQGVSYLRRPSQELFYGGSQRLRIEGLFDEGLEVLSLTQTLFRLMSHLDSATEKLSLKDTIWLATAITKCNLQEMELPVLMTLSFLIITVQENHFEADFMNEIGILYCICAILTMVQGPQRRAAFIDDHARIFSRLAPDSILAQQLLSLIEGQEDNLQYELGSRIKAKADANDVGITVGNYHLQMERDCGIIVAAPQGSGGQTRVGVLKPSQIRLDFDAASRDEILILSCMEAPIIGTWRAAWPLEARVYRTFKRAAKDL